MDVAQEASAPPCVVPFLHGRELFPCCDYLPRTARSGLPMAVVCNKKSQATCSLFCAAAPTSLRAAGSLFCGAPWTARRRRPPCVRCFAQPRPRRRKSSLDVAAEPRAMHVLVKPLNRGRMCNPNPSLTG
ncbi:uncharacterized protein LOC100276259 [Zea mays]|uniref:uncharacterized protein LOC100276259 n=1 Tax=Zea mays TaxID=4577 RepID=UPI000EAAD171|nr:uncharacterized protein LOC100276259 [Zea mays]